MSQPVSRVTIADVARRAGVSKATVSRFLNHRDTLLSAKIASRVEAAIVELGYVPSPMAQALKRGRSRLIGLVVADIANPYSVAVLRGAELACREAGYLVMLFNLGNESERESAGLRALSSYQVDGFILNTMGRDSGAAVEAARRGKPVVLVDRLHGGMDVDFVSLDNRQAVFASGAHLVQSGYRELLLVTEPVETVSSRLERVAAFKAFLDEQGDDVRGTVLECDGRDADRLMQALNSLCERAQQRSQSRHKAVAVLSGHDADDAPMQGGRCLPAIISGNAVVTLRVVAGLAAAGLRLGRNVGLVGIDDTEWAPYVGPGITTVSQPTDALGRMAAQCLIQRLNGLDAPPRKILLPGALMPRGSSVSLPDLAAASPR